MAERPLKKALAISYSRHSIPDSAAGECRSSA